MDFFLLHLIYNYIYIGVKISNNQYSFIVKILISFAFQNTHEKLQNKKNILKNIRRFRKHT